MSTTRTLDCGTGRRIINPEPGHGLGGYGPDYPCDDIHDDLAVTALYLHDGTTDALLLHFDLIGMRRPLVSEIRAAASAAAGVPPERVFTTCTQTHGGPEVRVRPATRKGARRSAARPDYNRRLVGLAAEAASWCLNRSIYRRSRRASGVMENDRPLVVAHGGARPCV